jgi:hypothetical protein
MTVPHSPRSHRQPWRPALAAALALLPAALAQMYDPPVATPGGIDPRPYLLSMARTQQVATVTWTGLNGPYQLLEQKTIGGAWEAVGDPTMDTRAAVPIDTDNGFLQVAGPGNAYLGARDCRFCHKDTHGHWTSTAHAGALQTLKNIGMDKNARCLPCHVVGYGLPGGYVDEATTPHLAGVQCENCHGPALNHADNFEDPSMRPAVTVSAAVCGGCHTDAHHPTYDEWQEAGHAHVSEGGMFNAGVGRMHQCGTCHSGAVRDAVVRDYDAGGNGTSVVSPTIADANKFGQTCSTCHDPHMESDEMLPGLDVHAKPAQLRNPIGSAKFMSFLTSTNPANFALQYDPDIQLCGQCHNERGADWTGTGRPPHHSPQYNLLIGQAVDPQKDTNLLSGAVVHFNQGPAGHGDPTQLAPFGNPAQCTACHNRAEEEEEPTPSSPNYTGHKFEVQTLACADCHGFLDDPMAEEIAEGGIEFIQAGIHDGIAKAMDSLDNWAATKIPGIDTPGHTNYIAFNGTNAPSAVIPWEFSTIGQLNPGKKGPGSAGQSRTPAAIKQSRFLLYLVEHDASYGVHNPPYARYLLQTAQKLANEAPAVPAQ